MQTNNKMAVAPVGKLIWQMSIPPLISMFLQYSYNLIDSAFVARLSENALTAVSLSFHRHTRIVTGLWNRCFAQPSVIPDYETLLSGIHQ